MSNTNYYYINICKKGEDFMRDFVIITDAGCDLPTHIIEELSVKVAPMSLTMNEKLYRHYHDYRELSESDFYQKIRNGIVGTTAGVNIKDTMDVMREVLEKDKDVLYLSFSSGLSGSYNYAQMAAEEMKEEFPDATIEVIDTKSACIGLGFLVYLATEKKNTGANMAEVSEYVNAIQQNIFHCFMVDDLMYLNQSGRISHLAAVAGTMLNIKPVFKLNPDGKIFDDGKVRGNIAGMKHLANRVKDKCVDHNVIFIGHGDNKDIAEKLKNQILDLYPDAKIILSCIGPIVGNCLGPDALAVAFMSDNR